MTPESASRKSVQVSRQSVSLWSCLRSTPENTTHQQACQWCTLGLLWLHECLSAVLTHQSRSAGATDAGPAPEGAASWPDSMAHFRQVWVTSHRRQNEHSETPTGCHMVWSMDLEEAYRLVNEDQARIRNEEEKKSALADRARWVRELQDATRTVLVTPGGARIHGRGCSVVLKSEAESDEKLARAFWVLGPRWPRAFKPEDAPRSPHRCCAVCGGPDLGAVPLL